MKRKLNNIFGWIFLILSVSIFIKYDALTAQWLLGIGAFALSVNHFNSARINKLEDQVKELQNA